jgi:hypothetical protein
MKSKTMRVLTVRQPWAWAIAAGFKDIENRPFRTDHRGDVAILAGRTWAGDDALKRVRRHASGAVPTRFQTGSVIAVVRLAGVHHRTDCDSACSPWVMPGMPWHWELTNLRPLDPTWPAYGSQGLVWASADAEREILARAA